MKSCLRKKNIYKWKITINSKRLQFLVEDGTWHFPGAILFWSMLGWGMILSSRAQWCADMCTLHLFNLFVPAWGFSWRMAEVTCDVRKCHPQWMVSLDRFWVQKKKQHEISLLIPSTRDNYRWGSVFEDSKSFTNLYLWEAVGCNSVEPLAWGGSQRLVSWWDVFFQLYYLYGVFEYSYLVFCTLSRKVRVLFIFGPPSVVSQSACAHEVLLRLRCFYCIFTSWYVVWICPHPSHETVI